MKKIFFLKKITNKQVLENVFEEKDEIREDFTTTSLPQTTTASLVQSKDCSKMIT